MYPPYVPRFSRAADFLGNMPSPDSGSTPSMGCQCQLESEVSRNSCSSGCSSYGSSSSLTSYGAQWQISESVMQMQRSISSHSLQRGGVHHPVSASFADLLEETPVRKVYSAGDLQERINGMQYNQRSESPLWSESSMIIEGMSRAYPYSPEEKKVRIERYRIKRYKRNFDKKIKYACRKTLADKRPRIRGRFAKNEETEKKSEIIEIESGGEEEEEEENWDNFFETLVLPNLVQEP